MLFMLFTQRKEMERKLGEVHEMETLGQRGLERVGVRHNETQRKKPKKRSGNKYTGFMQAAMRPPVSAAPERK